MNIIYCKANSNNSFLDEVILKIEKIINEKYNLNIELKPNVLKDRIKIEEQYFSLRKDDSIAIKYPKIAKEWDYEKNGQIKPEYITCGAQRKYWWLCDKGHSYECSPRDRINGRGCQICSGFNYIKGINDLETKYPHISKFWDYKLNDVTPSDIKYTNDRMYWWYCDKGHSYKTQIKTMIKYGECLGCTSKSIFILVKGVNDLLTKNPDICREWDYDKNEKTPDEYTYKSNKEVNWKCSKCGNKWISRIYKRTKCTSCKKQIAMINVYSIKDGSLIATYNSVVDLCKKMNINYKKQHGNITSICKRNQKTLKGRYILRYSRDDEFKNMIESDRVEKFYQILNR